MIYCDASVLVTALTPETKTSAAQEWLAREDLLSISPWVNTEVASAIARKRRMSLLSDEEADRIFGAWTVLRASLFMTAVEGLHFERAADFVRLSRESLRGPDALHVAIVESGAHRLATTDRALLRACEAFGVPAFNPLAD